MQKDLIKKQRYFIERDLFFQTLTLLLTVLLGGFLLLLLSKTISGYVETPILFLMLFVGYFLLIIFFAWSLSRKFVGPFSRLKGCMKDIAGGDLSLRLNVRSGDDVRIRTFVEDANRMVISFNNCIERCRPCSQDLKKRIEELTGRLQAEGEPDKEACLALLKELQARTGEISQALGKFKTRRRSLFDR